MLISHIPKIIARSEARAATVVDDIAGDIEAGARSRSRVGTGQMRDGWEVRAASRHAREVQNPIAHAILNELGTTETSARPMLVPAVEQARRPFAAAVKRLYE